MAQVNRKGCRCVEQNEIVAVLMKDASNEKPDLNDDNILYYNEKSQLLLLPSYFILHIARSQYRS